MASRTLRFLAWLWTLAGAVWAGAAAALVAWVLVDTAVWRQVELKLFDFLVVRSAPNQVTLPITIVGIDEATFGALGESWPLARRHHARLLETLADAGVAVVAFDITFPDAAAPQDDRRFAEAIRRFGAVVLASDLAFTESAAVRQWFRVDPHRMFVEAGAREGYAALEVDDDAILRRVPTVSDAFWRSVVRQFDSVHPGVAAATSASADMRIRYLGGPQTFPYVPYFKLLEPDKHLPPGWREFLRDNIVIVGRSLQVIGDVGAAQGEMYQTPFFLKTREFMPRVEAHANVIANMVSGQVLKEARLRWTNGLWLGAVLIALALMREWRLMRASVIAALLIAALAACEYAFFVYQQIWLPAAGAALAVALVYASQGAVAFVGEQRQRREIRNAFSRYVSAALVDQVIAHPEQLKLGGERREITILFSDLAGFTTLAERLDPERVTSIINRHFSEMTDTIQARAGMVQKFLGDGILAYWGVPVADARQSEHAVQAAIEMQRLVAKMATDLVGGEGAPLRMRIGINRGDCIVGNMGSASRFDYAAVGDPVNLASRIEGANKVYGTGILVSEAVVDAVRDGQRFREIDTVRVKGKYIGITLFTPCEDEALIALSAQALAAYREAQFHAAEEAFRQILAAHPADPVAPIFIARIAEFRQRGLPQLWDGIATLEAK